MLENGVQTANLRRETGRVMTDLEKLKVNEYADVQQMNVLWAVVCGLAQIAIVRTGISHVKLRLHIAHVAKQKHIVLDQKTLEAAMEQIFDIAHNKIGITANATKRGQYYKRHSA